MKNIVILYYPPFRQIPFPENYIRSLQGYRFFLFVVEEDFAQHSSLKKLPCVADVIPVNFNEQSLTAACDDIIRRYGQLDNIVYLAEECVQLSGRLRQYYGLSADNLDRYIDKNLMMVILHRAGVRVPHSLCFDTKRYLLEKQDYLLEVEEQLGVYPFFIKPANLCGSVGTYLVDNRAELQQWAANQAKQQQRFLVQEYVQGTLFHCECVVKKGEILQTCVFEYSNPGFAFSKGLAVGSISLPQVDPLAKKITEFTHEVLQTIGLIENGITHTEIFINYQGELICLEVAARPPGLVGDMLYEKHLGHAITELHFLLQLGACDDKLRDLAVKHYAVRYIFPFPCSGVFQKTYLTNGVQSEFSQSFLRSPGNRVEKSQDLFNVAATLIMWHCDYDELRQDFLLLKERQVTVVPAVEPIY